MASKSHGAHWLTPGAGILLPYNPNDETMRITVCVIFAIALYNSVELIILILLKFRSHGLYFWSLMASSLGIIPYSIAFMLMYLGITNHGGWVWAPYIMLTIGWWPMIIGQALVLWSRLHLIIFGRRGAKVICATKWMIICTSVFLCLPTTAITIASRNNNTIDHVYNVVEKVQMFGFCTQETILSSIYIVETVKLLRMSLRENTRQIMRQLIVINAIIIAMDIGLLGLECASLYILETTVKALIYSIKLKLEFVILGKLVQFVEVTKRLNSAVTVRADSCHTGQTNAPYQPRPVPLHRKSSSTSMLPSTNVATRNYSCISGSTVVPTLSHGGSESSWSTERIDISKLSSNHHSDLPTHFNG